MMLHRPGADEPERSEPPVISAQVERLTALQTYTAEMVERLRMTADRLLGSTPAEVELDEKETSKVKGSLNDLKIAVTELERKLHYLSEQIERVRNL